MKKLKIASIISAFYLLPLAGHAQKVTVTVTNELPTQRQELVEVSYDSIVKHITPGQYESIIVKNAFGQQITYQITHDRKLLFDVEILPLGKAIFTVEKGIPHPMKAWVYGKFYRERVDDITWENDRGIYRVYGPALQKTGERAFGIDVWTKNTSELVVKDRYTQALDGTTRQQKLLREGKKEQAEAIRLATTFHLDQGNGMDCYNVGPTLGCGTPALMSKGELIFPYCFKDYDILDNGPLRFTLALTYETKKIGDNDQVTEHRIISLDKGSNYNKMTVWYDGLQKPMDMAAGIVVHSTDKHDMMLGKDYLLYVDPTDAPEKHNFQIYTGILFPQSAQTKYLPKTNSDKGYEGHVVGIVKKLQNNARYTYYFGSAWSNYDVRTQTEWQLRSEEYMAALKSPLKVVIH
ncbi:hypothetical protein HMPREF3034_00612 [Prevotella sp. DNF00663]|uniref:DUF4861 domain-containing protein n=1 Tax=Prevotella sp. DNF00663 TaxID=1384078 RepID=UPI00078389AB|nr:DUF4861 domain-containing protein [Prevotella sp. DNF00663]KXB84699.1 hypothetical protein HMPREF3034_00612 [Prevotella sp. DNF00663]